MGFETLIHSQKYKSEEIIRQSLWDLKHSAIEASFFSFTIIRQSLWDLKLSQYIPNHEPCI